MCAHLLFLSNSYDLIMSTFSITTKDNSSSAKVKKENYKQKNK